VFSLSGKTVLVTGAAQGIGYGIAEVAAEAGAHVFTCDLDVVTGEAAAAELREAGRQVQFRAADVSSRKQVQDFIDFAVAATGRIDSLINNAAFTTGPQNNVVGATDQEWERNFRIALMGTQYCTQAVLPHMMQQRSGSILVISSVQALAACPDSTAYTSIKAAQLGFVRSAAHDYGKHNIRVNAICPGPIKVGYSPQQGSPALEWQISRTMLGRVGLSREIGYAAAFLASDESSYITGATIPVDGGWSAK